MSTALAPLWQLDEELTALLDSVATCPDDLQPELQAKIAEYVSAGAVKVDQCAHVLAALDYEQKCAADEIARLTDRKKAAAAAQERLEAYLCRVIAARGGKALKGTTNSLSVRPSDAVEITDAGAVPDAFKSVSVKMPAQSWESLMYVWIHFGPDDAKRFSAAEPSISLSEIKKALKAGEEVPGADLVYRSNLQRR